MRRVKLNAKWNNIAFAASAIKHHFDAVVVYAYSRLIAGGRLLFTARICICVDLFTRHVTILV